MGSTILTTYAMHVLEKGQPLVISVVLNIFRVSDFTAVFVIRPKSLETAGECFLGA